MSEVLLSLLAGQGIFWAGKEILQRAGKGCLDAFGKALVSRNTATGESKLFNEGMKSAWMRLVARCESNPRETLTEFRNVIASIGGPNEAERVLTMRIYMLRFQAGRDEVVHPSVVVAPMLSTAK